MRRHSFVLFPTNPGGAPILFLSFLLLIIASSVFAQQQVDDNANVNIAPLFAADDPLELTIVGDFKGILSGKDADDPEYFPAQLYFTGSDTTDQSFDIKIKARGISRRNFDFCTFPPLLLNFKKKETKQTLFDGQNKIKLVTFCKDMNSFEDYILKEYLVYKFFNILTDTSLQVRLTRITYQNINNEKVFAERFGFLIEDIDHLARRLKGKEIDLLLPNHDLCDRTSLDRFMVFQYFIGNTDWWIARPVMHNVKLISINSSPPIPIPYDFDYCGLVDTNYATPAENLPIRSVTQRYFRGFCRRPGSYEKTIQVYIDRKDQIYRLAQEFPYLSDGTRNVMIKFIDQFYDVITDPKQIKRRIYDACEIQHDHLHEL